MKPLLVHLLALTVPIVALSCRMVVTPAPVVIATPVMEAQPVAESAPEPSEVTSSVIDDGGQSITIQHGPAGDPAVVGCADGHREAFLDLGRYPRIAGCLATWAGRKSLRAPATGRPCGDELGPCGVPADACAPGWHVCGAGGEVKEVRQVSGEECEQAGGGRFSAAISHCKSQKGCAVDNRPGARYSCYPSGWCSEPVCCGRDCAQVGVCRSGVWEGKTHIPFGQDQGCGGMGSRRAGGVLCCR